jgi:RimJ/RimL family protein N-acetyltransferase
VIETERLMLRPPTDRDSPALVKLLSSRAVMADLTRDASVDSAERSLTRHRGYRERHGLGFWVVEHDGKVAGFCGLKPGAENTPIEGELEIGWIFGEQYWGHGFASEAAAASLDWAWANRPELRVVAITGASHQRSMRVMEKLGMHRVPDGDFRHPMFDAEDAMAHSVVFAIDRPMRG